MGAAARTGRPEAVREALGFSTGAAASRSVNRPDHRGWTPVMHAAHRGFSRVVEVLAEAGADLDHAETARGMTALRLAIRQNHSSTVAALLARRASPHAVAADGHSPLSAAAAAGNPVAVRILLSNGADPSAELEVGTPLMLAARFGHKAVVSVLVKAGADPNQQSPLNKCTSALLQAVAGGHAATAEHLLACGADVNQPNIYGSTPLMKAARAGHSGIVLLLLRGGADPAALDMYENAALGIAEQHGFHGCASLLRTALGGGTLPDAPRAAKDGPARE